MPRKVSLEVIVIHADEFVTDGPFPRFEFFNPVDEKKRITMREDPLNSLDIQCGRDL